jgi:hypothetical protein
MGDAFLQHNFYITAASIDYRCEDGQFPVSTSCVTISNPDSLSRRETEVNCGIEAEKALI